MRASFGVIVATFAGLTCAQSLTGLPTCAQSCVTGFTTGTSIGGCPSLDIACICSSKTFIPDIACCLDSNCDAADQQTAITFAGQLCKTAGVTVPDTLNGLCSTVSSSASGTATSSSSTASGTSATASTTSTGSTSTPTTTAASTTAASVTTGSSSSASASASATKNVAANNAAGVGLGFAGGVAAVMALL